MREDAPPSAAAAPIVRCAALRPFALLKGPPGMAPLPPGRPCAWPPVCAPARTSRRRSD